MYIKVCKHNHTLYSDQKGQFFPVQSSRDNKYTMVVMVMVEIINNGIAVKAMKSHKDAKSCTVLLTNSIVLCSQIKKHSLDNEFS